MGKSTRIRKPSAKLTAATSSEVKGSVAVPMSFPVKKVKSVGSKPTISMPKLTAIADLIAESKLGGGATAPGQIPVLTPIPKNNINNEEEEAQIVGEEGALSPLIKAKRKKAKGRNGNVYIGVENRVLWLELQERFGFESINCFSSFVLSYMNLVMEDFDALHDMALDVGIFADQGLAGFRWVKGMPHPVKENGSIFELKPRPATAEYIQKATELAVSMSQRRGQFLQNFSAGMEAGTDARSIKQEPKDEEEEEEGEGDFDVEDKDVDDATTASEIRGVVNDEFALGEDIQMEMPEDNSNINGSSAALLKVQVEVTFEDQDIPAVIPIPLSSSVEKLAVEELMDDLLEDVAKAAVVDSNNDVSPSSP